MKNYNEATMKRSTTEFLILDLEGKDKAEMLMNISRFAVNKGLVKDAEVLYQKFLARERERGIAVVPDIAFPEAYGIEMSRPYAFILCRTQQTVMFERADTGVRIILVSLFCAKSDTSCIRVMAKLSKLMRSQRFCEDFLKVKNEDEVYRAMARLEEIQ